MDGKLNRKVQPIGELRIVNTEIIGSVAYAVYAPVTITFVDENNQRWIHKTTVCKPDLKFEDPLATLNQAKG